VNLNLEKISKQDWSIMSQAAHAYSFGLERSNDMDRVSYALVTRKSDDELCCYSTIIEIDKDSAYMQHGGNFEAAKGTTMTLRGYLLMVNYLRETYKNVSTRVYNKNISMLKLSMAVGFVIVGCEVNKNGSLYLVLDLENCLPEEKNKDENE